MSVPVETPVATSTGNGVSTVFPHAFTVLLASDLVVVGIVNGIPVTYVNGVDYTVAGLGASSGSITMTVAPAVGTVLTRYRQTPVNRTTNYIFDGDLPATTLNQDIDRVVLMIQEMKNGSGALPLTFVQNLPLSGAFFAQNGAKINRINDRLFIGGATLNDGRFPNVQQDWFTQFQLSIGVPVGASVSSLLNVMNAGTTSETGAVGMLAAIQSKYFASAGTAAIAMEAFVVNNNTSLTTNAWAIYAEAHKTTSATASVYACELDTRNTVASVNPTPYQQGDVIGLQIASGAEYSTGFDGSAAIQIVNNLDKWKIGINFIATSITGTDGVTGFGTAIAFAKGHTMSWYNAAGQAVSNISGAVATAANGTSLVFSDQGLQISNSIGQAMAYFYPVASAANQVTFTAAAAASNPFIAAAGSDANPGITLRGKGTGSSGLADSAGVLKVAANSTGLGFFAAAPVAKPTATGSRGANAALASLLTALSNLGLITDSTS